MMPGPSGDLIVLWPDGAPGAVGAAEDDIPAITPYVVSAPGRARSAVVVCPGGGYAGLAPHEAEPVALWLNALGVSAFVLRYRLAPKYRYPSAHSDASRAIRTVRARAAEWDIDPAQIGILGFSAGGHLSSTVGTHFDAGNPEAADTIERASSRPDFMILIYPVISLKAFAHAGSRANLLGDPADPELVNYLSSEEQVTAETPPTFLIHTAGDTGVPCENSLLFAMALRRAGVPVELHLFEIGQHGFGLGEQNPVLAVWPNLCASWLRSRGWCG